MTKIEPVFSFSSYRHHGYLHQSEFAPSNVGLECLDTYKFHPSRNWEKIKYYVKFLIKKGRNSLEL